MRFTAKDGDGAESALPWVVGERSPLVAGSSAPPASVDTNDNTANRRPSIFWKAIGLVCASLAFSWAVFGMHSTGTNLGQEEKLLNVPDVGMKSHNVEIVKALLQLNLKMHGRVYFHSSVKERSRRKQNEFDRASRTWRQDRLPPLAVIEALSERDVALALPVLARLKVNYDFPFRVQSGGHHKAGYSTVAGGAVLSLSKMNQVVLGDDFYTAVQRRDAALASGRHYDPASDELSALITMQSGTLVQDFERELHVKHNYSGVSGACSSVAEGGFIMGGGFGFYSRKFGLGGDNVERMLVVLPNGTAINATKEENEDLFWAMRGAGSGNFGVMVEFDYRVHPIEDYKSFAIATVPMHYVATFLSAIGDMEASGSLPREFLLMYDGYSDNRRSINMANQKSESNSTDESSLANADKKSAKAVIILIWMGDMPESVRQGQCYIEGTIAPMLLTEAKDDLISIEHFTVSTSVISSGPAVGWGKSVYAAQEWCGFLYPANNTIEIWSKIHIKVADLLLDCPNLLPDIELWGGAINDVAANGTGFGHRQMIYNVGLLLMVSDVNMDDGAAAAAAKDSFNRQVAAVNRVWSSIAQYLNGVYVNYPMASLTKDEYPTAYWGGNLPRLSSIKRKYDPTNAFSYEQSIPLDA